MKKIFLLAGLLVSSPLFGQSIVVFAKGDFVVVKSAADIPAFPASSKSAFLAACQADIAHPAPFAPPLSLGAPPEWGKPVPGAAGRINFHDSFHGGFFVQVTLEGLAPDHLYILTLNGKPGLAGNERLVDLVPGLEKEKERYMDFMKITTDARGRYEATYGVALLPGPYDVRFYVKDTDDFKIVLYHDYFEFKVE